MQDYAFLYCLDLPEQGSKGSWTIGNMVDNLKEFINSIDDPFIDEIHLAGHSAGATAIISFLCNYNAELEIINSNSNDDKLLETLVEKGLGKAIKEQQKVSKLFLYSPPDSFEIVFPKKLSSFLKARSLPFNKVFFNLIVNWPMILLKLFTTNKYVNFSRDSTGSLQYFKLIPMDYKAFFDYLLTYVSIFEWHEISGSIFEKSLKSSFQDKNILICYGSNDWLIKPFFRRKETLKKALKLTDSVKVIKHKSLGHLLSNKWRFDINLNSQFITNKNVITESKKQLKNYGN
jgi:hypothetical protein